MTMTNSIRDFLNQLSAGQRDLKIIEADGSKRSGGKAERQMLKVKNLTYTNVT